MERSGVGRTGAEWRAGVRGEGGEEGAAGRVAKEWGGAEESVEEWEERERRHLDEGARGKDGARAEGGGEREEKGQGKGRVSPWRSREAPRGP